MGLGWLLSPDFPSISKWHGSAVTTDQQEANWPGKTSNIQLASAANTAYVDKCGRVKYRTILLASVTQVRKRLEGDNGGEDLAP